MRRADHNLARAALPVLALVALIGYLAGHRHPHGASTQAKLTASAGSVLLTYPPSWHTAPAAPAIPGLTIAHAVVLTPNGDAAHAGLVAGQLPAGEPSPLPRRLVAVMRTFPETSVVNLAEVDAFRYARLDVPGFGRTLTLYAIPNPAGDPTVLACYASAAFLADMAACQQIVSTLTLVGQGQTDDLTPSAAYASRLKAAVQLLDRRRGELRRQLATQAEGPSMQRLATDLASLFATAAGSLSALEPPLIAGHAQTVLIAALQSARAAYAKLAAAATAGDSARLAAARTQVYAAESGVNRGLESFAFLGYTPG